MRSVLVAAVLATLALPALMLPAAAQNKDFGRGSPLPPEPKTQVDESKYHSALDAIPNAQTSNDPWAGARDVAGSQPEAPKRSAKRPKQH